MDIKLKKKTAKYIKVVFSSTFTHEETSEIIVPDALPDILSVIDTDGQVLLRSKEADSGRISMSGIVAANIIYRPDGEEGLKKMDANIQFSASFADSRVTDESKLVVCADIYSIETRVINPRKVLIRADILICIEGFNDCEDELSYEIESEDCVAEVLKESCVSRIITDVNEKTFVIDEDFVLSASKPPIGEIIKTKVRLTADEAKAVGTKAIFKGDMWASVIYKSVSGEICSSDFTSSFSQMVEMDELDEDCKLDVKLMLTGAYFEVSGSDTADGKSITAEIHAVAQVISYRKQKNDYIADIYSTSHELSSQFMSVDMELIANKFVVAEMLRETIPLQERARGILDVHVHLGKTTFEIHEGMVNAAVPINAAVMYIIESGEICSENKRFEVKSQFAANEGSVYAVCANIPIDHYVTDSVEGLELRVPVSFEIYESVNKKIDVLRSSEYDENTTIDLTGKPSLIVHRTVHGETLWTMSKRYYSTKALIMSANDMSDEAVQAGTLLIVPKKRA